MHQRMRDIIGCVTAFTALASIGWGDVVIRNDGRRIEGLVLSESSLEVTIKLDSGAVVRLPRRRVRSVERSNWKEIVERGDNAGDPAEALEFYTKAKELNPSAPGIDAKIESAKQRLKQEADRLGQEQDRERRRLQEDEILAQYERLMDAAKPEAARAYLEKEIAANPWLSRPRLRVAEFYARVRTPEGQAKYIDMLHGLVRNDARAYHALYAPRLVEAAERVLLDGGENGAIPFKAKDRLLADAAPFVGSDGAFLSADAYIKREAEMKSPALAALAKIDFLKSVCMKRPDGEPKVEPEVPTLLAYAKQLGPPWDNADLRARLAEWAKEANRLAQSGQRSKAAVAGEIVLVFDPKSNLARSIAMGSRVHEARMFRERGVYDRARKSLEAAESIDPESPQVAIEKVQLYLALAKRYTGTGDFANAVDAVLVAEKTGAAARKVAPQIAATAGKEKDRLRNILTARADAVALQQDYGSAIETLELAMRISPTGLLATFTSNVDKKLKKYRTALVNTSLVQMDTNYNRRKAFFQLAATQETAKKYGVYSLKVGTPPAETTIELEFQKLIKDMNKEAEEFANNNDNVGLFQNLGRQLMLGDNTATRQRYEAAKKQAVEGGQLPVQVLHGFWAGQGARWGLGSTQIDFQGGGWRIVETNLSETQIRFQYGMGDRYTVQVDRSESQDTFSFRVVGPDEILLESLTSAPTNAPDTPPTVANFSLSLRREPPPVGPEQSADGQGTGAGSRPRTTPGTTSDAES